MTQWGLRCSLRWIARWESVGVLANVLERWPAVFFLSQMNRSELCWCSADVLADWLTDWLTSWEIFRHGWMWFKWSCKFCLHTNIPFCLVFFARCLWVMCCVCLSKSTGWILDQPIYCIHTFAYFLINYGLEEWPMFLAWHFLKNTKPSLFAWFPLT